MNTPTPRVSFSPFVEGRSILHVQDYSDSEVASTWYSPQDLARFQADIRETVFFMVQGLLLKEDDGCHGYCALGLESSTAEGMQARRTRRSDAAQAVFEEQDIQYNDGILDTDRLAMIYHDITRDCQRSAERAGLEHHIRQNTHESEKDHFSLFRFRC